MLLLFVQTYQKRKEVPYIEMSRDNAQNRKKNLLEWKSHVTMTKKDADISIEMQFRNHSLIFFTITNHFFQLPAFYLVHTWLTTLLLPWTS